MKNIRFLLSKTSTAEEVQLNAHTTPITGDVSAVSSQTGKACLEMCLNVVVLSIAMVSSLFPLLCPSPSSPTPDHTLLLFFPPPTLLPSPTPITTPSPATLSHLSPLLPFSSAPSSLLQVVSGSGDLDVLRVIRRLHARVTHPEVTYGSHMATHMALGLLFLGGCR